MNIFVLADSPDLAARLQCNKHVVKMSSETANLLLWPFKHLNQALPPTQSGEPIRLTHENHPASIWTRASKQNYDWALTHLESLCSEYARRYGREHYATTYLNFCKQNYRLLSLPNIGSTPFARCFSSFSDVLANVEGVVEAYRSFYILDKISFARWPSVDSIPDWWPTKDHSFVDKSFVSGVYAKRLS